MALDNFTNLKASIADWLNRSDLTNVIPDFISLAEAQLNRELRHYKQQEKATALIDTQYSATPPDWLQTVRFHLNDDNATLFLFLIVLHPITLILYLFSRKFLTK